LDLSIEWDGSADHIIEYFGHVGSEFEVTGFLDLCAKYLVFTHSVKIHLQGSDKTGLSVLQGLYLLRFWVLGVKIPPMAI
jgi:hypothetical protein